MAEPPEFARHGEACPRTGSKHVIGPISGRCKHCNGLASGWTWQAIDAALKAEQPEITPLSVNKASQISLDAMNRIFAHIRSMAEKSVFTDPIVTGEYDEKRGWCPPDVAARQAAVLAEAKAQIFRLGLATYEELQDNIITTAELTTLGWTEDFVTKNWTAPGLADFWRSKGDHDRLEVLTSAKLVGSWKTIVADAPLPRPSDAAAPLPQPFQELDASKLIVTDTYTIAARDFIERQFPEIIAQKNARIATLEADNKVLEDQKDQMAAKIVDLEARLVRYVERFRHWRSRALQLAIELATLKRHQSPHPVPVESSLSEPAKPSQDAIWRNATRFSR